MGKCLILHLAGVSSTGNVRSVIITWNNSLFNVSRTCYCKKWYKSKPLKVFFFLLIILIPATVQVKWDTCILWLVSWFVGTKASFTKLCDASYDQLTCRRSHELILLTNRYITLGCVTRTLPCVALRYAARSELRWCARTGCTNSMYENLCEIPLWSHIPNIWPDLLDHATYCTHSVKKFVST